jgi:hypothetical protein
LGDSLFARNVLPDVESSVHKRLCIDAMTNGATLYWETAGAKVNSKTFRTVIGLREWLERKLTGFVSVA